MNAFDLIGAAGAASLAERLSVVSDGDGIARFMLDRLTGPQVAAIVRALLQDQATESRMRIVVPRSLVAGQDLPESVVTDERTVALRHAECDRPALLIANTDDDQGASLQDVTLIGAKQLSENPVFWVGSAAHGLGLPDEQLRAWEAALRGLAETTTVNDYSLMERPVRDPSEAATDVDPAEAARQIRTLIERYLDLQPHERSNLSIMLYNCDAAGLPLATINALGSVQDQEEVHCNVLVRHRDRPKLSRVYSELLERSESDPDAVVVSETSRNFMSKLRIGVMLDGGVGSSSTEYRNVDVAFLHDVVSRQAKEAWFAIAPGAAEPSLLDHVPARWSYRRVTAEDELKATSYLACPRQPSVGWAYVDAVAGVVRRQSHPEGEHYLPARQISFQDHGLKSMFDEVHGLAEWVATYDDLLDKRQLAAQGIKVIRYRRQRTHGRNMVVSSTSELRILHVLVRRRLTELNLGIADDRLSPSASGTTQPSIYSIANTCSSKTRRLSRRLSPSGSTLTQ
ncbi:MAG: hypothetical protein EOS10_11735 [Mesorhizobium sp.]|uniref:hypothetical protein n=1 Tax=Mesorhizobium sp. TaxID=1871066 RepID=UPI000FE5F687|nr:hypothetical protein [Mesorhizobium sp.]RWO32360.1 MAG: hypothetical protein EOS10_11735 [Mesorhizobium sp.]